MGESRGLKNLRSFFQCWLSAGSARPVLLLAHGHAERRRRYRHLVGRTAGECVQVDSHEDRLADLEAWLRIRT